MVDNRSYIKKRRVPRRKFRRRVGLLAKGEYDVTDAIEIGEGGMLIHSSRELLSGQKIVLSFNVPGFVYVVCRGQIRYVKKASENDGGENLYGVQFDNIEFNAKRQIRTYVAQKSLFEE